MIDDGGAPMDIAASVGTGSGDGSGIGPALVLGSCPSCGQDLGTVQAQAETSCYGVTTYIYRASHVCRDGVFAVWLDPWIVADTTGPADA